MRTAMPRAFRSWTFLLTLLVLCWSAGAQAATVLLRQARVDDPDSGQVRSVDVLLRDGRPPSRRARQRARSARADRGDRWWHLSWR